MAPERSVAIVTGGASGIGRATAALLAGSGWRVGLIDRDGRAVAAASAELGAGAACEAAVVQMTRVLASEWAEHRIRVNAVAPGPVETPMTAATHVEAGRRMWLEATPMRRYATPREIATAIAFLLDPEQSGYVTGVCLPVDGGFTGSGLWRGQVMPAGGAPPGHASPSACRA